MGNFFSDLFSNIKKARKERSDKAIAELKKRRNPGEQQAGMFYVSRLTIHNSDFLGCVIQYCGDNDKNLPKFLVGMNYRHTTQYSDAATSGILLAGIELSVGEKAQLQVKKMNYPIHKIYGFNIIYQDQPGIVDLDGKPIPQYTVPVRGSFEREGFLCHFKYSPD